MSTRRDFYFLEPSLITDLSYNRITLRPGKTDGISCNRDLPYSLLLVYPGGVWQQDVDEDRMGCLPEALAMMEQAFFFLGGDA